MWTLSDSISDFPSERIGVAGQWRAHSLGEEPWAVAICLLMLLALVAVAWRGRRYLVYRLRSIFAAERHFARMGDYTSAHTIPLLMVLLLVCCASIGLMHVERFQYVSLPHLPGLLTWQQWLLWTTAVAAILCLKSMLYALVGWTFLTKAARTAWMAAYILLTACCAFPFFVVCVCYLRGLFGIAEMTFCLLFVLILYEILLFYRLRKNFPAKIGGQVLAFLYLCTLEIAPLLIAQRFLSILSEV